ncbi:MAG: hypothetical protein EXQ92_07050 [Alphaproteobacteria bacterium]|nr:hypothetical protein [Alphaproteobacteria bacterium]
MATMLQSARDDSAAAPKGLPVDSGTMDLAMRAARASVWDWDAISNKVYFSPHFREILGYGQAERDAIVADSPKLLVHPDDIDRLMIDELVEHIGEDDAAQVLGDAARALPERARRVEATREDTEKLARSAHDLASTAATVGLIELSSLGQRIERLCAAGDFPGA